MSGSDGFKRRDIVRGGLAAGSLAGLGGAGLWSPAKAATAPKIMRPPLVPMKVGVEEIIDVQCCLRPFRAAGPNLDAQQYGDALVIHNYGHGGSGWSLSWGSAEVAVGKALSVLPKEIAVIGCGVVGLTAAVHAQRAGLKVTIYAREVFQRTRSVRAGGSWSPDSRVSLAAPAGPAFGPLWEHMSRVSWKAFRSYIGLPGEPVRFGDQYNLSDTPFGHEEHEAVDPTKPTYATTGAPQQNGEFGKYEDRIRDIVPAFYDLAREDNPFDTPYAKFASVMHFNFGAYGHLLMQQFLEGGGTFVQKDFHTPADFATLKEKVVIHSTGLAAKALMNDKTMFPVRGQNARLSAQPEANYGVSYRGVSLLSKTDGVRFNASRAGGEMLGVNDGNEVPDRKEIEDGLKTIAPLFAKFRT